MKNRSAFASLILLPAVVALACGCATTAGAAKPEPPTPKREQYPGTALIVVDVQRAVFPVHRQEVFLAAVRLLIERANEAGAAVIYVYHSEGGAFTPGRDSWLLHPTVTPPEGAEQIRKILPDSFSGTELEALLDARRVGRVVICGLGSTACVGATCWGAFGRGYDLVLPSDAHSMPLSSSSEAAIDAFSASWKDDGATVLPAQEVDFTRP